MIKASRTHKTAKLDQTSVKRGHDVLRRQRNDSQTAKKMNTGRNEFSIIRNDELSFHNLFESIRCCCDLFVIYSRNSKTKTNNEKGRTSSPSVAILSRTFFQLSAILVFRPFQQCVFTTEPLKVHYLSSLHS